MSKAATFEVLTSLERRVFTPGANILVEHTPACDSSDLYLLNSGHAIVTFKDKELALLEKGSIFGEICFMGKSNKRTATVTAVTYCDTLALSSSHYKKILARHPDLQQTMHKSIEDASEKRLQARIHLETALSSLVGNLRMGADTMRKSFKMTRKPRAAGDSADLSQAIADEIDADEEKAPRQPLTFASQDPPRGAGRKVVPSTLVDGKTEV
jgi:CRP-like cAMP-binding protein